MASTIETRLAELGVTLPQAPAAVGIYVPVIRTGSLVVTSGQLPMKDGSLAFTGKAGSDLSVEQSAAAAKLAVINCLAQIRTCLGSLDHVRRIVRVEGYVNSANGFHSQPAVMNGASQFLSDVFGPAGSHTRIAVGVNELPLNAAVEVVVWAETDQPE